MSSMRKRLARGMVGEGLARLDFAVLILVTLATFVSCAASPDRGFMSPPSVAPDAAFLAKSMEERWIAAVDVRLRAGLGWGYLAAFRDAGKTRWLARGWRSLEPVRSVSVKDSFEIGSVTQLFTGILLHLAAEEKKLALGDPLAKFFPELAGVPAGAITLEELGRHRSGLPSTPPTITQHKFGNPWSEWTKEQVLAPLRQIVLSDLPVAGGLRPEVYSNWGYMVLGLVLERAYRQSFTQSLRQKILTPLRMGETGVDRTVVVKRRRRVLKRISRLMPSFTLAADPTSSWEFTESAAATGGLESTLTDMGKFLEAIDSSLAPESRARARIPERLRAAIHASRKTGVGWDSGAGGAYAWKNGGTAAFSAVVAWNEESRRGVFIAGNSPVAVDALAGVALGRNRVDGLASRVQSAKIPTEKSLAAVRGLYRVTDPAPKTVANGELSLRTVEILESFGHLRARLDIGAQEKEGALVLGTSDEDEWVLLGPRGASHFFEISRGGAELVVYESDGKKTEYELKKVERSIEQYPAFE